MVGGKVRKALVRVLSVLLLLVAAGGFWSFALRPVRAEQPPALPQHVESDVTYCTADGVALKMDIYSPPVLGQAPSPAALFVHGGAWSGGDKADGEGTPETVELVGRGYVVASVNYRLAPRYVFPAQIEDVKCAVRYLRANASALHIDPNRIGAWGASAGGQLVSLLGTADESAGLEGDGGYPAESSRVQAVVDMYGRADLRTVPATRPDLLPVFGTEADLPRYSPVTYVSKDDPPFLILHGEQDTVVPPELSREFYGRLTETGVPATLVMVKNAEHGFAPAGGPISPSRAEITRMVGEFFDRYLKGALQPPSSSRPVAHAEPLPASGDTLQCPQTGKSIRGIFLDYWRSHGGLAQQGFPISDEMQEVSPTDGKPYAVQYFERAVFEYHPENQSPYQVLASLLGARRYRARYPNGPGPAQRPAQLPSDSGGSVVFKETGHRVSGVFLKYWRQHGSLIQQGYPVSDEFTEKSALDGKPYTVQYFERAVFEYHPENDEANRVLLSHLGTFEYKSKHAPGRTAYPTPTGK